MRTKTKQNRSRQNLALEQVSIPVGKETATILGSTDAALILQQLHFWLSLPGVGRVVSGIKWIYNTYKQWLQELPWLKETKWRKAMRQLRNLGIVKFDQLDAREWKQRGWYSIDYQRLKALIPSICANSPNQSDESQLIDSLKSDESSIYTEKTNRDSLSESSAPANAAPEPHPDVCENPLEKTFQEDLSKHLGKNEINKQLAQENENLDQDNYSAAATPQIEAKYSMPLNEVEHVKPKLKSDSLSGFYSQDERDNFYQVLLEMAKHKSGVRSIVGWANAIIKSINASEPCEYLNEFRRGDLVGTCEKHEWEIAPGKPYPQLLTYLKRRLKSNLMSDDQAIATAYQELSDVNRATAHWESFKRTIANTKADWDKQQALGVSSAYIPPELMPEREVPVEEAVNAMRELQANCIHPALEPSVPDLSSAQMNLPLEPTEDKTLPTAELEPEPPAESIAPPLHDLQERLNDRNRLMVSATRYMIEANPQWGYLVDNELNLVLPVEGPPPVGHLQWLLNNTLTASKVRHLLEQNPNWGLFIDLDGQVSDF